MTAFPEVVFKTNPELYLSLSKPNTFNKIPGIPAEVNIFRIKAYQLATNACENGFNNAVFPLYSLEYCSQTPREIRRLGSSLP